VPRRRWALAAAVAVVAAFLGASATLHADAGSTRSERTVLATVDGEPITYGEFVAYGRTLLDETGKVLTVTPEALLDQMVNRALIVREAHHRGLRPRPEVVAAGSDEGSGDPRMRESIAKREGFAQYVANLEVFDLYTQLREQVLGTVTLTAAERAALPPAASAVDRRIAEERAARDKADRLWLAWLAELRSHATITRRPAPTWP
jgi:hypothetical protein